MRFSFCLEYSRLSKPMELCRWDIIGIFWAYTFVVEVEILMLNWVYARDVVVYLCQWSYVYSVVAEGESKETGFK